MIYTWLAWKRNDENGGFILRTPWWLTETHFVAAVPTGDVDDAKRCIVDAHDRRRGLLLSWDAAMVLNNEGPFCDRFPKQEWMQWPQTNRYSVVFSLPPNSQFVPSMDNSCIFEASRSNHTGAVFYRINVPSDKMTSLCIGLDYNRLKFALKTENDECFGTTVCVFVRSGQIVVTGSRLGRDKRHFFIGDVEFMIEST